jgi:hypothetical protein
MHLAHTCSLPLNSFLQGVDELLVDNRRGRLLKKLLVLIRGPILMEPLKRFTKRSILNILTILAVHIIFFAIFFTLVQMRLG